MAIKIVNCQIYHSVVVGARHGQTYCYNPETLTELNINARRIEPVEIPKGDKIVSLVSTQLTACHTLFIRCPEKKLTSMMYVPNAIGDGSDLDMFSAQSVKAVPYNDFTLGYSNKDEYPGHCLNEDDSVDIIVVGPNPGRYKEKKIREQLGCNIKHIKYIKIPDDIKLEEPGYHLAGVLKIGMNESFRAEKREVPSSHCSVAYLVEKDLLAIIGKDSNDDRIFMVYKGVFANIHDNNTKPEISWDSTSAEASTISELKAQYDFKRFYEAAVTFIPLFLDPSLGE